MKLKTPVRWIFVLAGFTILITGCPAVLVGGSATGIVWYRGELRADIDATPDQVIEATKKAFQDHKWFALSADSSKTEGTAVARTTDDKRVTVKVKKKTEKDSEIGIRVGPVGDQEASRALLAKIETFL